MTTQRKQKRTVALARPGNRVVIVTRISDDRGEDRVGHETQEAGCRAKAAALGLDVVAAFADDISGDRIDRPGLIAGIDMIRDGTADVLMTYAVDRLARDVALQFGIIGQVRQAGGRYVSAKDDVPEGPMGDAIMAMLAAGAAIELGNIRERVNRGLDARFRQQGKFKPGGKPAYGYAKVGTGADAAYEVNPAEARIVRRIFDEVAAGKSHRKVAADLNRDRIPSPKGARWWEPAIAKILEREAYWTGRHAAWKWGTERDGDNVPRKVVRPEEDRYYVEFPTVVDPAVAERARATAARNRWKGARADRPGVPALLRSGFARCGECGRALGVIAPKIGNPRYACTTKLTGVRCATKPSISRDFLDGPVWDWAWSVMTDPNRADRWVVLPAAPVIDRDAERELADAEAAVAALADQAGRLLDNLELLSGVAARLAADRLNAMNDRLTAAEAERDRIASRVAAANVLPKIARFRPEGAAETVMAAIDAMKATDPEGEQPYRVLVWRNAAGRETVTTVPDTVEAKQAALAVLGVEVAVNAEATGRPRWEATATLPGEVAEWNVYRTPASSARP